MLAGLTIIEASEKMKTSPATVCNWENGKHKPNATSLNKLAVAYNRDVADFYVVDVPTIRVQATSDLMSYYTDPNADIHRRAGYSVQILVQLPDVGSHDVPEPTEAENRNHDLLAKGVEPDIADE